MAVITRCKRCIAKARAMASRRVEPERVEWARPEASNPFHAFDAASADGLAWSRRVQWRAVHAIEAAVQARRCPIAPPSPCPHSRVALFTRSHVLMANRLNTVFCAAAALVLVASVPHA
jgi:hypothetical protein